MRDDDVQSYHVVLLQIAFLSPISIVAYDGFCLDPNIQEGSRQNRTCLFSGWNLHLLIWAYTFFIITFLVFSLSNKSFKTREVPGPRSFLLSNRSRPLVYETLSGVSLGLEFLLLFPFLFLVYFLLNGFGTSSWHFPLSLASKRECTKTLPDWEMRVGDAQGAMQFSWLSVVLGMVKTLEIA